MRTYVIFSPCMICTYSHSGRPRGRDFQGGFQSPGLPHTYCLQVLRIYIEHLLYFCCVYIVNSFLMSIIVTSRPGCGRRTAAIACRFWRVTRTRSSRVPSTMTATPLSPGPKTILVEYGNANPQTHLQSNDGQSILK